MGGSKNKSPAQKDKSQKKDAESKKSKKSEKSNVTKTTTSVIIDESKAIKYINAAKIITVQDLARQTEVKISAANSYLQKLLKDGTVERIGGFSGHHYTNQFLESDKTSLGFTVFNLSTPSVILPIIVICFPANTSSR